MGPSRGSASVIGRRRPGLGPRVPRPRKAITPIASHVRPKLMSDTAAGVYGWLRPSSERYGPNAALRARNVAIVYSPMTMASVRNAPDRSAVRRFGKITRHRIRAQPEPRLWAASVRVRTSIAARPVSTARYMYGNDRTTYAADEHQVAAEARCRQLDRPAGVDPDEPEHEDDGRDDEGHQRHELDDRAEARHPEPDPVGGRHDDQQADDDRDHADRERVEQADAELLVGQDLAVGQEDVRPRPDRVDERPDQRQEEVRGAEDEDEPGPERAERWRRRGGRAWSMTVSSGLVARRSADRYRS